MTFFLLNEEMTLTSKIKLVPIKVFQFFGSQGGPNQNERRQRQLTGTTVYLFFRRHNGEEMTGLRPWEADDVIYMLISPKISQNTL
jgi:hypothetical protein